MVETLDRLGRRVFRDRAIRHAAVEIFATAQES
jgi:hypothetical protein